MAGSGQSRVEVEAYSEGYKNSVKTQPDAAAGIDFYILFTCAPSIFTPFLRRAPYTGFMPVRDGNHTIWPQGKEKLTGSLLGALKAGAPKAETTVSSCIRRRRI